MAHRAGTGAAPDPVGLSLERALSAAWGLRIEAYRKFEGAPVTTYENVFSPFSLVPEIGIDQVEVAAQRARMQGVETTLESDRSAPWSASFRTRGPAPRTSWPGSGRPDPGISQRGASERTLARRPWHVSGMLSWHSGWPYTPLLVSNINGAIRRRHSRARAPQ